jgi:hypothetical protein
MPWLEMLKPIKPRLCRLHWLPIEESLGYCVRCLSAEVDPSEAGQGSWWWRIRGWEVCRCREPEVVFYYRAPLCRRCHQMLMEDAHPKPSSTVPEGEHHVVLDRERKTA